MPVYEYKVVPAPVKGQKGKGVKGPQGRFALALETVMNELGADGWEYLRADTLPSEERSGLTGSTTTFQNMLVFRREKSAAIAALPAPAAEAEAPTAAAPDAPIPAPRAETPLVAERAPTTTDSAAAAAAAALSAYRDSPPEGPKLGPASDGNTRGVAAE